MHFFTRLLPAVLLAPTLALSAADTDAPLSKTDVTFIQKATIYNLAEVQAAELALTRDLTIDERTYAQQLMDQHKQANRDLATLANRKNVIVSETMPSAVQEKIAELRGYQGNEFNERFLEERIDCHRKALSYLDDARESSDPDVRMYAQAGLIAVQQHLDTAKRLEARY